MNKFFEELGYKVGDKVRCAQVSDKSYLYEVNKVYELIPYEEKNKEWPTIYIDGIYHNGFGANWVKMGY